jgi:hypothetical protein
LLVAGVGAEADLVHALRFLVLELFELFVAAEKNGFAKRVFWRYPRSVGGAGFLEGAAAFSSEQM